MLAETLKSSPLRALGFSIRNVRCLRVRCLSFQTFKRCTSPKDRWRWRENLVIRFHFRSPLKVFWKDNRLKALGCCRYAGFLLMVYTKVSTTRSDRNLALNYRLEFAGDHRNSHWLLVRDLLNPKRNPKLEFYSSNSNEFQNLKTWIEHFLWKAPLGNHFKRECPLNALKSERF